MTSPLTSPLVVAQLSEAKKIQDRIEEKPLKPTRQEIFMARKKAGLTVADAAFLSNLRTIKAWQEDPDSVELSRMDWYRWEMFQLRAGVHPSSRLVQKSDGKPPVFRTGDPESLPITEAPTPAMVKELRVSLGLTQGQIAVLAGLKNQANWCSAEQEGRAIVRLDPLRWELLLLRTDRHPTLILELIDKDALAKLAKVPTDKEVREVLFSQRLVSATRKLDSIALIKETLEEHGITLAQMLYFFDRTRPVAAPIDEAHLELMESISDSITDDGIELDDFLKRPYRIRNIDNRFGLQQISDHDARAGLQPVVYRHKDGTGWSKRGNVPRVMKDLLLTEEGRRSITVEYCEGDKVWMMGKGGSLPDWVKARVVAGTIFEAERWVETKVSTAEAIQRKKQALEKELERKRTNAAAMAKKFGYRKVEPVPAEAKKADQD